MAYNKKEYYLEIDKVFADLIKQFHLEKIIVNDYEYCLSNSKICLNFLLGKYQPTVSIFLKDVINNKQYPFWKLYVKRGKPKIIIDVSQDEFIKNLLWHSKFIEMYMLKEMEGDFSEINSDLM